MGVPNVHEEVAIHSRTRSLREVRDFVSRMVRNSALPARDHNKIVLAVDEAVANVIEHAYQSREDGEIHVRIELHDDQFCVIIRDHGANFDPDGVPGVDMSEHIAQGRQRGLGLFLIRKIMDEVRYTYEEGARNELILIKRIEPSDASSP